MDLRPLAAHGPVVTTASSPFGHRLQRPSLEDHSRGLACPLYELTQQNAQLFDHDRERSRSDLPLHLLVSQLPGKSSETSLGYSDRTLCPSFHRQRHGLNLGRSELNLTPMGTSGLMENGFDRNREKGPTKMLPLLDLREIISYFIDVLLLLLRKIYPVLFTMSNRTLRYLLGT